MRRQVGALVIAATLLAFAPGLAGNAARAHTTDGWLWAGHCFFTDSGEATVTAGSEVVIATGWLTNLRGDQLAFLDAQTVIVSVNDGPMWDVSDQWSEPTAGASSNWASWLSIPTGVTLASGEQMRFTLAILLKRDVRADGGYGVPPNVYPAGLYFGGTCTVTGV